jgi:hypothetical protein
MKPKLKNEIDTYVEDITAFVNDCKETNAHFKLPVIRSKDFELISSIRTPKDYRNIHDTLQLGCKVLNEKFNDTDIEEKLKAKVVLHNTIARYHLSHVNICENYLEEDFTNGIYHQFYYESLKDIVSEFKIDIGKSLIFGRYINPEQKVQKLFDILSIENGLMQYYHFKNRISKRICEVDKIEVFKDTASGDYFFHDKSSDHWFMILGELLIFDPQVSENGSSEDLPF